jgi:hypothetical protein
MDKWLVELFMPMSRSLCLRFLPTNIKFGIQALLCLGYLPDIWYEAALFMQQAAQILEEKGDVKISSIMRTEITSKQNGRNLTNIYPYAIIILELFERGISGLMRDSGSFYCVLSSEF